MARNKYPEQTVDKILRIAAKLFAKKGYDKTSVQDILNEVGMSKGAIYHHFNSKEEILDAVMEQHFEHTKTLFNSALTQGNNAIENLINAFEYLTSHEDVREMDEIIQSQIKNPQFVLKSLQNTMDDSAPMVANVLEAGNKDGSLKVQYPVETAEVIMLLLNIWINPVLFLRTREETIKRIEFLRYMLKQLGIDIVSDTMIDNINAIYIKIGGYNNKQK